jgi:translocator protein
MQKRELLALVGFIALCLGVSALAGLVTIPSVQVWYPTLNKPSWTPPPWLFGPVWTVLYIMMGIAAWLVWRKGLMARPALLVFYAQLFLNLSWSFLFFGLQSPLLGLIDIVAMWVMIVVTIRIFYVHSGWAAALLVPYLAWVSFATALNAAIFMLN